MRKKDRTQKGELKDKTRMIVLCCFVALAFSTKRKESQQRSHDTRFGEASREIIVCSSWDQLFFLFDKGFANVLLGARSERYILCTSLN